MSYCIARLAGTAKHATLLLELFWAAGQPPRSEADIDFAPTACDVFSVMSDKELVLDLLKRLPEDADLKQIQGGIEFLAAIRKGEEEADRGEVVPHDRVKEDFRSWTTK